MCALGFGPALCSGRRLDLGIVERIKRKGLCSLQVMTSARGYRGEASTSTLLQRNSCHEQNSEADLHSSSDMQPRSLPPHRNTATPLILLDAAKWVGTSPLCLRSVPADFVVLSFYKMIGYPTGLGALIVRNGAFYLYTIETIKYLNLCCACKCTREF